MSAATVKSSTTIEPGDLDPRVDRYWPGKPFRNQRDLDLRLRMHFDHVFDHDINMQRFSLRTLMQQGQRLTFRDIFYCVDRLYDNLPGSVIDVGCGENLWRQWFPNIQGFDCCMPYFNGPDFIDHFDPDFSQGHRQYWQCGLAINSLHFVDWSAVSAQLDLAMQMVTDRFLFTFNLHQIKNKPLAADDPAIVPALRQILEHSGYDLVLLDWPVERGISADTVESWAHLNGHVRFILAHPESK